MYALPPFLQILDNWNFIIGDKNTRVVPDTSIVDVYEERFVIVVRKFYYASFGMQLFVH